MAIYDEIQKDMIVNFKSGNKKISSFLKFLKAEIQRDPNKNYTDDNCIAIIKKVATSLKENVHVDSTEEIGFVYSHYLPVQVTEEQIREFVNTIDFSKLKNKMAAIGMVMKNFPIGSVNGDLVKSIIMSM